MTSFTERTTRARARLADPLRRGPQHESEGRVWWEVSSDLDHTCYALEVDGVGVLVRVEGGGGVSALAWLPGVSLLALALGDEHPHSYSDGAGEGGASDGTTP